MTGNRRQELRRAIREIASAGGVVQYVEDAGPFSEGAVDLGVKLGLFRANNAGGAWGDEIVVALTKKGWAASGIVRPASAWKRLLGWVSKWRSI